MKKILFPLLLLFTLSFFGQNFEKNWKKVIEFEETGNIKSALIEVNKIYEKAKRKDSDLEVIKTFFFRAKYMQVLEEDVQTKIISNLKIDISELSEPSKTLLEYIYISCLNKYWLQNLYKIARRTETQNAFNKDFLTWTIPDFKREIDNYINKASTNNTILKNKPLKDYELILDFEKLENIEDKSLYDFLLKKYIAIYSQHLNRWDDTSPYFDEIENLIFGDTSEFLSVKFDSLPNSDIKNTSLLYAELERIHPNDEQLEFERIQFFETYVYKNETSYLANLNRFQKRVKDTALIKKVQLARAEVYSKMASKTEHPEHNKMAMQILDSILSVPSRTNTYKNAFIKKQKMLVKSINITLQKYIYEGENTRALVEFKNADSLYLKLFKVPSQFQYINNIRNRDSIINALINNSKFEKIVGYKLPNKDDLFSYSTEVLLPTLEKGKYLILFATDKARFDEKSNRDFTYVCVTDLSILQKENGNTDYFQIVNRQTGKPVEDATLQLNDSIKKTDAYGNVSILRKKFKQGEDRNAILKVTKGADTLNLDYYKRYYHEYNSENEEFTGNVKFYMDRAIYRPGQKAYVKAIAFQNKNGVKSVVPYLTVYVEVYDVNYDTVIEKEIQTNEFGSFTFDFDIPKNGITGRYFIEADEPDNLEKDELYNAEEEEHLFWDFVDFNSSETEFNVEEYKRPTFKIEFDPITASFAVNEMVSASGKAISYSGVNLNDSKVTYSVERNSYPNYWQRHFPDETLTITQGETTTDADGNFKIDFTALPYLNLKKENLPIFEYTVSADITDGRGETQSAETTIKVGYHTLKLSASIPSIINTKNENILKLNSTNLNGSFLATKGILKIYYRSPLDTKFKNRVFNTPDIAGFTAEEFERLFPYEKTYNNEEKDDLGTLIFSKKINTEIDKEIQTDFLKSKKVGNYSLVFSATDTLDNYIETTSNFIVLQDNNNQSNKLFTINRTNANPFKDGFVELEIESEIKTLYLNISTKLGTSIIKNPVQLKNGFLKVKAPIDVQRSEDITLYFETYFENHFFSEPFTIVKNNDGEIDIAIKSFKNKIEPGSPQTWSFTITNKNKAAEAEVLASMYDSSLDQFKTTNWEGLKIHNYYQYNNYSRTSELSNGTAYTNLSALNDLLPKFYFSDETVDVYWFGFDFNNPILKTIINNRILLNSKIPTNATMVYGVVTDDTGLPLPGVNVIVRGTSRGTQSDFDGYYSIEVAPGEILDISYVGFSSKNFIVSSGENNVSLEPSSELDEVVVTGYSVRNQTVQAFAVVSTIETLLQGKSAGVAITKNAEFSSGIGTAMMVRGNTSIISNKVLIIIDGVPVVFGDNSGNSINKDNIINLAKLDPDNIANLSFLEGEEATSLYGSAAVNGVVIITTKTALEELKKVTPRKNFNETAFFYPQLKTDKEGQISFNFTSPEALTQWKLRLFSHDKNALSGYLENMVITQKELMIAPNMPRFFREKDTIQITARISNLTSENKSGIGILQLFDAITMEPIDIETGNEINFRNFKTSPKGNTTVSWKINIPEGIQGIQYKVLAKAGDFSDGEENIIPVLTNNILVTESIPLWVRGNTEREYTFEKIKNNTSTTLKNHQLTLEYTSNPTWLAIRALPYLMEYEHECAEQTFARYYANTITVNIINNNPKIAAYFESLKAENPVSELEKNEELKSILLAETPWFNDAQTDKEKKAQLALLFDLEKIRTAQQTAYEKLSGQQMSSGAFPWFQGGPENEFITRHILAGLGKITKRSDTLPSNLSFMTKKGIAFLDKKFEERFNSNKKIISAQKRFLPDYIELHYLYTRSFYLKSNPISDSLKLKINKDLSFLKVNWLNLSLYEKGMATLVFKHFDDKKTAEKIINNLRETASNNEYWGMYWIENKPSWYWYQSPIETQAILINAFTEVENDKKSVEAMKVWLLKNKQVKHWSSTKSTTEAIDALLSSGTDWTTVKDKTKFQLGNSKVLQQKLEETKKETETGYIKINIESSEINKDMATLKINNKSEVPGYGGFYWQYFEDLDKIKLSPDQPLKVTKELYLKKNTNDGQQLQQIITENPLKIGDLITVRLIISAKEDMEFVHLKDMRASALEPIDVISRYNYKDGLGYYMSTRDAATHFFFDAINKGTYVLEYDIRVNNIGQFSNGITTIQSMYAPEYSNHSKGIRIKIEE